MQTKEITSNGDDILSEREAAEILRVSPFTLARLRKRGRIAFHLVGWQIRYSGRDVAAFLEGVRRPQSGEPVESSDPSLEIGAAAIDLAVAALGELA